MKVLVTGANGYIGSKVVKVLCDRGIEVIATDLSKQHIDCRANFVPANIFEPKDDWFAFFERPDVCIHLAWRNGFVHNDESHIIDLPKHFSFLTNLIKNGLPSLVCMGTMHEVGYWVGEIDENTPCKPLSQYGIAKNALRQSIELYSNANGCKLMWLRAYYIFGDDFYGNSIFCKIRQAVSKNETSFPLTSGKNKYDFINVDVLAKQIVACSLQDKILGIINCCSGKPVSLSEQIEWYIKENNLPIKLLYGAYPDRPYDSPCIFGNPDKINSITRGFEENKG